MSADVDVTLTRHEARVLLRALAVYRAWCPVDTAVRAGAIRCLVTLLREKVG